MHEQFLTDNKINFKDAGSNQLNVETCPECHNTNFKVYINSETGMWDCKVCAVTGGFWKFKAYFIESTMSTEVTSVNEAAAAKDKKPLPNLHLMHDLLMNNEQYADVLDYLLSERKFTIAAIEQMKVGADYWAKTDDYFVIYPFFDKDGTPVYYKGRNLPKEGKKRIMRSPEGYPAPLYNSAILRPGMKELVICEGEADTVSLISAGFPDVVGVPGASTKKAEWIELLDKLSPKVIYLCYDGDTAGQKNSREIASRIGLDRCRNVTLPSETLPNGNPTKDVNDYFRMGHTLEDFLTLLQSSKPYDIEGISSVIEVLDELTVDLENGPTKPRFLTPWDALNKKVGGFEEGDLVGIMAEGKVGKTTMALNMLDWYASQGDGSFLFCQEMLPKRVVRKWVSYKTLTDDTPGKSMITKDTVIQALGFAKEMPGDLLFGFNPGCKAEEIYNTLRMVKRRYGIKVACFDNLQMMIKSLETSQQETSKYTKMFKQIAMELKILMLLIIQPHRVAEGNIVSARNAMGSSAIEKDVDFMLCLHRNRTGSTKANDFTGFVDTEEAMQPELLVNVDLARFAPGGKCTLLINGATSSITEYAAPISGIDVPAVAISL